MTSCAYPPIGQVSASSLVRDRDAPARDTGLLRGTSQVRVVSRESLVGVYMALLTITVGTALAGGPRADPSVRHW